MVYTSISSIILAIRWKIRAACFCTLESRGKWTLFWISLWVSKNSLSINKINNPGKNAERGHSLNIFYTFIFYCSFISEFLMKFWSLHLLPNKNCFNETFGFTFFWDNNPDFALLSLFISLSYLFSSQQNQQEKK